MDRLESISRHLAHSFKFSSEATKAEALYFACSDAVGESGLDGREISNALENIRAGTIDNSLSQSMHDLSKAYDDKYFELTSDDAEEPLQSGALENFMKARAASALAFGLESGQSSEALYEAISASSNRDNIIARIQQML